ncbi:testis expressed 264 [Nesidiocoris tenuis]|uniref:Testis expressed 264 n=1 Tax=Nesidiocoris tenuis TaxID=355587 RepID=A0ABN7A8W8_9HEMI|nr:testis expressed 264 [Nesidiocoris tenuis]
MDMDAHLVMVAQTVAAILTCLAVWYVYHLMTVVPQMGPLPFGDLLIAYKYGYLGRTPCHRLGYIRNCFPWKNLVKFCYSGPKTNRVEFAHGAILTDAVSPDLLARLSELGVSIHKTPPISHALYVSYPVVRWLPFTSFFAIRLAYPKLDAYIQKYNLCAYPVMEIYTWTTATILMPLTKQDEFVVPEAERVVFGKNPSAMLTGVKNLSLPPPMTTYVPKKIPVNSSVKSGASSRSVTKMTTRSSVRATKG